MLGPRLKYSCALYEQENASLAEAEEAMLELTCERAQLGPNQRILELGCGWGSLTLFMAEAYPDSNITAVSNAHSQRQFIEAEAQARGLTNITVLTQDMNNFEPDGQFDRVVSIEMFEHMRNYQRLLDMVTPDYVHVMQKGKIVQTGDISIAAQLEEGGFASLA